MAVTEAELTEVKWGNSKGNSGSGRFRYRNVINTADSRFWMLHNVVMLWNMHRTTFTSCLQVSHLQHLHLSGVPPLRSRRHCTRQQLRGRRSRDKVQLLRPELRSMYLNLEKFVAVTCDVVWQFGYISLFLTFLH